MLCVFLVAKKIDYRVFFFAKKIDYRVFFFAKKIESCRNKIKMEPINPHGDALIRSKIANYPPETREYFYSKENENKPKYWCQSGVKNYVAEYDEKLKKNQYKTTESREDATSYISPIYDKHLCLGLDYIVLCRFQMKYIPDFSGSEKRPNIDLESFKKFMSTYVSEITLQTLNNQIYSSKNNFHKLTEYVTNGLVNITLNFGNHKFVAENERLKKICQHPPYNLACLLINPDDYYHKHHPNGSQNLIYNMLCSNSYFTKPAAKQELGEERGFYMMQWGQTFYLISHEICIKEMLPNSALDTAETKNTQQNILLFDNIATMYTGLKNGYKIVNYTAGKSSTNTATNQSTPESALIYNVVWSNFYLTELTKQTASYLMGCIKNFYTFVKAIRDENCYVNYTGINPRQKIIFDIVTMFCDGLSVGFESKNAIFTDSKSKNIQQV